MWTFLYLWRQALGQKDVSIAVEEGFRPRACESQYGEVSPHYRFVHILISFLSMKNIGGTLGQLGRS